MTTTPANPPAWAAVDAHITDVFLHPTTSSESWQEATLAASKAANLPDIAVSPPQGKFLHILAKIQNARRILEVGTLGGYSTIWLAKALPKDDASAKVVTLEISEEHARVAKSNIKNAGLEDKVSVIVGPALESLPKLANEAPFDLVFIDADKPNNPNYIDWVLKLKLAREGTVIIVDNVVRKGSIVDESHQDVNVIGSRQALLKLGGNASLDGTVLQTVGVKGYDGFAIARLERGAIS